MLPKVSQRPPLSGSRALLYDQKLANHLSGNSKHPTAPSLRLITDKEVYRPDDFINATIEIQCTDAAVRNHESDDATVYACPFLIENLTIEIKGVEKLDTQWFITQKPLSGSRQRRGEQIFLNSTSASIISKVIVSSGGTKTYMVRAQVPKVLPPSYKGTSVRYFYYIRSSLSGRWLVLDNYYSNGEALKDLIHLARANEVSSGLEDDYDSARDEISSVASYSHSKGNLGSAFGSALSLHSPPSTSGKEYHQPEGASIPSVRVVPEISTTEDLFEANGNLLSSVGNSTGKSILQKRLGSYPSGILSPSQLRRHTNPFFGNDEMGENSPSISETESFVRGRSYNIRMDDQVLLRFSPKNSDSIYYFNDMIGGALTFFHGDGSRRCLEVSITLETSETISQPFIHPSRRHSPTITKVHSDHYEVVADLVQSSFLFSIPMDGPMSFSTQHVTVQWSLRFEFVTTPGNVDWTRYDHPLLVEGREKGEWVLPITVHPPPPRTQTSQSRDERPLSPGSLWIRT
ncbi:RAB6A-GEF complex partner protein 2 [Nymphaea thermarum]|nr:RAB6A-GEF complex partner protein 2 [Nymphaea thermarum]